ncbi:carbon-nitrogen hydrolase family protein [bacterium]|nr:carbon-nitrogen hydrolase family protein [bacterium]
MQQTFKVASVQAAPVFLDLDATIDKAVGLIKEAAENGANLIVFPESFVPAYPLWVWFIPPGKTHPLRELYSHFHANSVDIQGPHMSRIAKAAGEYQVNVVLGVSELNSEASGSSLYNTLVYFGSDGQILGKHRKLVPTGGERLVWAQAGSSDLKTYDLGFATVGGLICWENYMPLARHTLAAMGQHIHCAPTWDRGEPWISTLRHIAKEGRCLVIGSCQFFRKSDIPDSFSFKTEYLSDIDDVINPGSSVIVSPDGKLLAGPAEGETVLYAEMSSEQIQGPRWQLDTAGHYSRPDVFSLHVVTEEKPQIVLDKKS